MPQSFYLLTSGEINMHYLRTYCLLFYPGRKFVDTADFADVPSGAAYIYAAVGVHPHDARDFSPEDIPALAESLPAKGVWLCVNGVNNEDEAEAVMRMIGKWRSGK